MNEQTQPTETTTTTPTPTPRKWTSTAGPIQTNKVNKALKHTRGRGSNPRSRVNLRPAVRRWWVYSRGAGIGWTREFGPFFQKQATELARSLESMNGSNLHPMYVASMEDLTLPTKAESALVDKITNL